MPDICERAYADWDCFAWHCKCQLQGIRIVNPDELVGKNNIF